METFIIVKPRLKATLDSRKPSSAFFSPDSCEEVANGGNDSVFTHRNNRVQVHIEPSSDENSCSYSKYDKDEPELKAPITSYPQYQEYVQEFRDKYDSYLSLKKILESSSDVIKKLAVESEDAKVRGDMDRYNAICEQIKESYKPIYEKWKKVFLLLHVELLSIKQRVKEVDVERRKRLRAENLTPEDTYKDPNIEAGNRADRQGSSDVGFQKGNDHALLQTGQRSSDEIPLGNPSYPLEKSAKHGESIRHNRKHSGRDFHAHEFSSAQKDRSHGDARNGNIQVTEKKKPRNPQKNILGIDLNKLPPIEIDSDMDSDFSEGSFKDTDTSEGLNSEITKVKSSFKTTLDSGKPSSAFSSPEFASNLESTSKTNVDNHFEDSTKFCSRQTLQHLKADNAKVGSQNKLTEMSSKCRNSKSVANQEYIDLDSSPESNKSVSGHVSKQTEMSSKCRNSKSGANREYIGLDSIPESNKRVPGHASKQTEMSSKCRNSKSGANQEYIDLDSSSESNRRVPGHDSKQDTKRGMVSHPLKESKGQTPHSCEEVADGGKDSVFADRDNRDQQKRESSSDENHCSYLKYDKDEPELKGPITSYPQYEEYVQELQDKFDSYLSLDKILEAYSDEFKKLIVEYEDAKASGDMDRYNEITEQIKETDRRCRARYEKLEKIYLVLQAELWSIKQRINDFVGENYIGCLSCLELWGDT